jgi:integrase
MRNQWRLNFEKSLRQNLGEWEAQAVVGRRPGTVAYNRRLACLIRDSWRHDLDTPCTAITAEGVGEFARRIERFSPSQYNHLINVARALVPAASFLPRKRETPKISLLPRRPAFEELLRELERGRNPAAAKIVRLLACTGLRIGEARSLQASDVLPDGLLVRKSKNGRPRLVPYIGDCRAIVTDLLKSKNGSPSLLPVQSIRRALGCACRRLGIPPLSHHDFRRLFATRCIESRVDLPTAARWLGHSDGGALLGRTYFHLLDEHSASMAAKVEI